MNDLPEKETIPHPSLKIIFGLILAGLILAGLFSVFSLAGASTSSLLVFGEILLIVPTIVYLNRKNYNLREVFRFNLIDPKLIYLSFPLGISITVLSDEIDRIVGTFIEIPAEWQEMLAKYLIADSPLEWFNLFLGAVVLPGIFEEMLFRGMLQKAFERKFELHQAIFLTAFVFAIIHLPFQLIQIMILGTVLGFIAWRSNSIIPAIILHGLNNGFALILANSNPESWNWYNWNGHVNPTVLVIAAGLLFYSAKSFFRLTKNTYAA
ncbi:CPBP family intramembrane metalloprotease [candidate division KSB1 bacterium]|nr:CPBP family intramembrane metalloprotease [candidate division KSB1 bacterium]